MMEEALQAIHQTPSPSGRSAPIDIVPNSSRQRYHTNPTTDDSSDEDADAGETDLFRDMVGSVPRHASSLSMRGGSLIHRGRLGAGGARSLPPPRAPFLSSQTDPNDRLHSMPVMSLPECAESISSSVDDDGQLGTSFQKSYGSLRESSFAAPNRSIGAASYTHHHVRFAASPVDRQNSHGDDSGRSAFFPSSLPTYMDGDLNLVQQRWEQHSTTSSNSATVALETQQGLLSSQLDNASSTTAVPIPVGGGGGGGIGGALGEYESNSPKRQPFIGSMTRSEEPGEPFRNGPAEDTVDGGGSSLTAFSVLESARQQTPGLGVSFSVEEVEGARESVTRLAASFQEFTVEQRPHNHRQEGAHESVTRLAASFQEFTMEQRLAGQHGHNHHQQRSSLHPPETDMSGMDEFTLDSTTEVVDGGGIGAILYTSELQPPHAQPQQEPQHPLDYSHDVDRPDYDEYADTIGAFDLEFE
eukprot:CAMPEP_0198303030 /NCGR_PEP_ID=MMETSP1449-20131203/56679_1 /TAXON_ID=420275 /ORGANISM="Attheya septentrionalis, Strain CCMP2084" /LENGTH=470 /DNA_ID=CAMNT_0044005511 /DNA_START=825 /DNA_END=2237 /DNA_ORIENTATION=-